MKKLFLQNWRYSAPLARHAWRCYLNRPDVTVDRMSWPSINSWVACNAVWNTLKPEEQEMLRLFHRSENDPATARDAVRRWEAEHGAEPGTVIRTIRRTYKLWAVERGLADAEAEEGEGKKPEETEQKRGDINAGTETNQGSRPE